MHAVLIKGLNIDEVLLNRCKHFYESVQFYWSVAQ